MNFELTRIFAGSIQNTLRMLPAGNLFFGMISDCNLAAANHLGLDAKMTID